MGSKARQLRKHFLCFSQNMATARFVAPESTLGNFIGEQADKNTLSKTKRDVSLLKEFTDENEGKKTKNSKSMIPESSTKYFAHSFWR